MKYETRPYADLSAVFCDELLMQDEEMFYGASKRTFENATKLRKEQTSAEEILWDKLRRKQLSGFRFRRQHPIGKYIADFYCHKRKLAVEIDGTVHKKGEQVEHDNIRTAEMNSHGINVVRFTNDDIHFKMDQVLYTIAQALASPPLQGRLGRGQGRPGGAHAQEILE
jgi:very-short-patch-repair endonuclease